MSLLQNVTWSGIGCSPLLSVSYDEVGLPAEAVSHLPIWLASVHDHPSLTPAAKCCRPNKLFVVDNCTMWCIIPDKYVDLGKGEKHSTKPLSAISECMREFANSSIGSPGMLGGAGRSGGKDASKTSLALWAVLVAGYAVATM